MCRQLRTNEAVSGLRLDSEQLAELPSFPSGVSVRAIAGNVSVDSCALWGCNTEDTNGDLVVSVISATAEYTSNGNGDGKRVFVCKSKSFEMLNAWCNHNNMLKAPQVQADVRASIEAYRASVKAAANPLPALPPHQTVTLFGKLEMPFLNEWFSSMSEPDKTENIVDGTHCAMSAAECPHIYVFNLDDDSSNLVKEDVCWTGESAHPANGKLKGPKAVTIGGKSAAYYEQTLCKAEGSTPDIVQYTWVVPGQLRISAMSYTVAPLALDDLKAVLANIRWLH
jgi:hypothetical protein